MPKKALDKRQIEKLRRFRRFGATTQYLADMYGVNYGTVIRYVWDIEPDLQARNTAVSVKKSTLQKWLSSVPCEEIRLPKWIVEGYGIESEEQSK